MSDAHVFTNDKEINIMPSVELVESERTSYIKGMKDYLQNLKQLPEDEAIKKAQKSLEGCHIIQADGEFTERYHYTKTLSKA